MKKIQLIATALSLSLAFAACGNSSSEPGVTNPEELAKGPEVHGDLIKAEDVQLTSPLNATWVAEGKGIYEMKCQACHNLDDVKKVGPGWKGLTQKREPHWLMNMITNVDIMLEKDAEAQKLLEQCLVRMPNQNVSKEDARKILEYMRHNDGQK